MLVFEQVVEYVVVQCKFGWEVVVYICFWQVCVFCDYCGVGVGEFVFCEYGFCVCEQMGFVGFVNVCFVLL